MGILDFLQTPEAQMGIGLLAAGGPSTTPMNVGQRVQLAMQGMSAQQQNALKMKLLQSQVDENASQNALRQAQLTQQQRRDAYFMGDGMGGGSASPAAGLPGSAGMPGGAPMAAPGVAAAGSPVAAGGDKFSQMAAQYRVPREALVMDYMTNGGKGIAEMIAKRGTPNWQNVNGNLVDTNAAGFNGGLQAGMASSADGKVTAWQPDGQGGLVVGAPRGALDTFSAYKSVEANLKPFKVYNPQTQREEYTTEGAVVAPMAGQRGNVQSSGYAGGDRNGANAESIRMIQSELAKPGNSPADVAAMQREVQRLQTQSGVAPQSGNFAAGPSSTEAATAKANEARAVDTAKADVGRDSAAIKKVKSAGEMVAAVRRARELLNEGPTGSGGGEVIDKTAAFFGKSMQGADVAAKLDIVGGELLNNVPRMEGPQSDGDRIEYKIQAGRAADRSVPVKQRLAAMDEMERLQMKYAGLNGGAPAAATPAANASAPTTGKTFKDFGYASEADAIKDAQRAMLKNPGARPEILRRLKEAGVTLPNGGQGSW